MDQNTIFISYRRSLSRHLARSIYQHLTMNDWDVFLDVNTIDSGDFDRIILNQIGARAHFILIITKDSLKRCTNPGDWVLLEIEEAVRLNRNIVPIVEEEADFTKELSYLPETLRDTISKKNMLPLHHFFFDAAMDMLRTRFLKIPNYVKIQKPPTRELTEVKRRLKAIETESIPPDGLEVKASADPFMPAPFAWINLDVPGKDYSISKYPITNGQFAKFIEADGYNTKKWWTEQGWQERQSGGWKEPPYWNDSNWNGADKPIVGVTWFEAVAFCLWMSEATGQKIMLPTENQWQYAAVGMARTTYPWGEAWDCKRCNNSVHPCNSNGTTPVTRYEGKGDSPFGVVDMAGNVWEWCLTDFDKKTNEVNSRAAKRVLRGGSWFYNTPVRFASDYRFWSEPATCDYQFGFRIFRF